VQEYNLWHPPCRIPLTLISPANSAMYSEDLFAQVDAAASNLNFEFGSFGSNVSGTSSVDFRDLGSSSRGLADQSCGIITPPDSPPPATLLDSGLCDPFRVLVVLTNPSSSFLLKFCRLITLFRSFNSCPIPFSRIAVRESMSSFYQTVQTR
jgi:hypothetical protein